MQHLALELVLGREGLALEVVGVQAHQPGAEQVVGIGLRVGVGTGIAAAATAATTTTTTTRLLLAAGRRRLQQALELGGQVLGGQRKGVLDGPGAQEVVDDVKVAALVG